MSRRYPLALRICADVPTRPERCAGKILDFFGIESRTIDAERLATEGPPTDCSSYSAIVSATHLAVVAGERSELPAVLRDAHSVFVFGFDDSPPMQRLLGWLTGRPDTACRVRRLTSTSLEVTAESPDMFGPLSGLTASITAVDNSVAVDGVRGCAGFQSMIRDGAGDVFFQCRRNGVTFCVAASEPAVDIDEPVPGSFFDIRESFGSTVPLVAFLRREFASAFAAPDALGATLIVDDPSLKRRYGFLDFEATLAAMRRHDFSTTIAFIPWNWWRTRPRTAALFQSDPERYSLTVHGCDHTGHEFGTHSAAILQRKIGLALQRAERHRQKTGLRISPIMVFPQGVFSAEAADALQRSPFMAAVNTEVHPSDGDGSPRTEVRELWRPAITKYSGFPIFTRRYIEHGIENVAFDTLLGKPCLLVAHHEVFRNGASNLLTFVDRVNAQIHPVWSSLENVIRRSHLVHGTADGPARIDMFANEMMLRGQRDRRETVVVTRVAPTAAVSRVTCDGLDIPWEHQNGRVRFVVDVPPASPVLVRVQHVGPETVPLAAEGLRYRARVLARRYLSEVRDDYISRYRYLYTCALLLLRLFE
jgi:hypothetical protein